MFRLSLPTALCCLVSNFLSPSVSAAAIDVGNANFSMDTSSVVVAGNLRDFGDSNEITITQRRSFDTPVGCTEKFQIPLVGE